MKKFMDEDFLLYNETGKRLFHHYAEKMPIIDYHCHLNPKEIYEDKKFENITEAWLGGDHYKWRLMRANGFSDELIQKGDSFDKFKAWAKTVPNAIGNPLYHWTHLELKRYFQCDLLLNEQNAEKIYQICNEQLKNLSARKIIEMSHVEVICTTDDPLEDLKYHQLLKSENFSCKVLPSFRPDKAMNLNLKGFPDWVDGLEKICGSVISTLKDFERALIQRIDYFHEVGCKVADQGLDQMVYQEGTYEEVNQIFLKARRREILTAQEVSQYRGYLLLFFGREYHKRNWVQQYHLKALRNNSKKMLEKLGPDTGFDAISDASFAESLSKVLSALDYTDELAKTVLYSLNDRDNEVLLALGYCFNQGMEGKIQLGSAWWFNDHIKGMTKQLEDLANGGLLSKFIGMLTDSRSFLSYTRHEYFRRILCNKIGEYVELGQYPEEEAFLKKIIQDICYYNALQYFLF